MPQEETGYADYYNHTAYFLRRKNDKNAQARCDFFERHKKSDFEFNASWEKAGLYVNSSGRKMNLAMTSDNEAIIGFCKSSSKKTNEKINLFSHKETIVWDETKQWMPYFVSLDFTDHGSLIMKDEIWSKYCAHERSDFIVNPCETFPGIYKFTSELSARIEFFEIDGTGLIAGITKADNTTSDYLSRTIIFVFNLENKKGTFFLWKGGKKSITEADFEKTSFGTLKITLDNKDKTVYALKN